MNRITGAALFCLTAAVALASCAARTQAATNADAQPEPVPVSDWSAFRGDPGLSGSVMGAPTPNSFGIVWRFDAAEAFVSAAVIADGRVFFAGAEGSLLCLDAATGSLVWRITVEDGFEASPLYRNGSLLIGSLSGSFFACDAADGSTLWRAEIGTRISGSANSFPYAAGPEGAAALVFFGNYDSKIYALNADTGSVVWSYASQNFINGSPALFGGNRLAFAGCDGFLRVLDAADGALVSETELGVYVPGSPAYADGALYAASYDGTVRRVDAATGEVAWENRVGEGVSFFSSPAADASLVVIGSRNGKLYGFDPARGALRWTFTAGGAMDAPPLLVGGNVFAGSGDGVYYLIDGATGAELHSLPAEGAVQAGAAYSGGRLFVASTEGVILCLELQP